MPYEYVWKTAPRNLGLPVSHELLDGFVEDYVWNFVKQIRVTSNVKDELAYFRHSKECNGWILCKPMENEEYTGLSGGDGTAHYCCRCGHEIISFVRRMS